MFLVIKTCNSKDKNYGIVAKTFDSQVSAKLYLDNLYDNGIKAVIAVTDRNLKQGKVIPNYKPNNYLRSYMHPERNPDPSIAVKLFSYD